MCGRIFTELGQRYPSKPCPTCSGRKWMDPKKNFDRLLRATTLGARVQRLLELEQPNERELCQSVLINKH